MKRINLFIFLPIVILVFVGFYFYGFSSQTSKYHYILQRYYTPKALIIGVLKTDAPIEKSFTGTWFDWAKNGQLLYSTEMKNGLQNGNKYFCPNNRLESSGFNDENNKFTGIVFEDFMDFDGKKKYFEKGVLCKTIYYHNSKFFTEVNFYENDEIVKKIDSTLNVSLYKDKKLIKNFDVLSILLENLGLNKRSLNKDDIEIIRLIIQDKNLNLENDPKVSFSVNDPKLGKDVDLKIIWNITNGKLKVRIFNDENKLIAEQEIE